MTAAGGPKGPAGTQGTAGTAATQAGHAAPIVSLEDIRQAEEIISALAGRRGLPPGGRADPAAQLLAALCADVDVGRDIGAAASASPVADVMASASAGRAATSPALAAASARWNRDVPPDDVAGPGSPGRVPRLRRVRAGRKVPVRALATGLAAVAAVVTVAVLARPAGSHDATAPLAGLLQPAGASATVTPSGHHGGLLTGPREGTSGLVPQAPGLSSPGQRARGSSGGGPGGPAVSPGAAGSAAGPHSTVSSRGGGTQRSAGTANPGASQPAVDAPARTPARASAAGRDRVTRAGSPPAHSGAVITVPARQRTAASHSATSRAAATRAGPAQSAGPRAAPDAGRARHSRSARRTDPQPWQFWLTGPGHASHHNPARP